MVGGEMKEDQAGQALCGIDTAYMCHRQKIMGVDLLLQIRTSKAAGMAWIEDHSGA